MTDLIRHADPERDAGACAAIYAPYVTASPASFEDVAPTPAELGRRIEQTTRSHPWIVLQNNGEVIAYAYASPHHPRPAYRWAAAVAVYVDPAHHRRGAGRALYDALLDLLRRQLLWAAVAGITLPNEASVGLHRAFGFEAVGVYRDIGWKAGGWRDVSWWQLRLRTPDANGAPPAEPLGPQRLAGDPA
jgi:L-amino acid N-acyltransferase YncA